MSFDLYLLPARAVRGDAERARAYVEREDESFDEIPAARDPESEVKKRELADVLKRMKPHYREFEMNFDAIAEDEGISADEARRKYRHIELNGAETPAEAQVLFFDRYVLVHWYSGTSGDDMDAILKALCVSGDFVVYDPQEDEVYDYRE